jgi:Rrf2 family protein
MATSCVGFATAMLNSTTELALRALLVIGLDGAGRPLSPRRLSERLECSPSYLAKVLRMLVRARILRSVRGARGGVLLERRADTVTVLDILEACQGIIAPGYCRAVDLSVVPVCAFHRMASEVHHATVEVLARWKLSDLLAHPVPDRDLGGLAPCRMAFLGCERFRVRDEAVPVER